MKSKGKLASTWRKLNRDKDLTDHYLRDVTEAGVTGKCMALEAYVTYNIKSISLQGNINKYTFIKCQMSALLKTLLKE